jgi:soluble lytic murein transglycosylase-like protein
MTSVTLALALSCGLNLQAVLGFTKNYTTIPNVARALQDRIPELVQATMIIGAIESGLQANVRRGAAGEIGMFQMLPSNVPWLKKRCGVTGDPRDEAVSAQLAYCYLEHLYELSGGDIIATVAAYNAGPSAITKLRNKQRLPQITAEYLRRYKHLREKAHACRNQSTL